MDHRKNPVPGTRVTVPYRKADGHGCPGHVGTVLAPNDPAAWAGTIAFEGRTLDQQSIDAHIARFPCLATCETRTPVAWDFGRVYWEPSSALECV